MRWGFSLTYFALGLVVTMSACKDDDPESKKETTPPFSNEEYAIFMAYTYDSLPSSTGKKILCSGVWTNATSKTDSASAYKLSPGRDEGVEVFDIFVTEDKTVYVAGCFGNAAAYWKNESEIELPEGRAATSVAVDHDGVVYTCGFQQEGFSETAKMWIDTKPVLLKNGSRANRLSLNNGKCYIAGYGNNESKDDTEEARIWIDGQSYNRLSQDNDDKNEFGDYPAIANDIVSTGESWWCVGQERNSVVGYLPKVWINRTNNNLTKEGPQSTLNCISYENGKFYIGGNDGYHAKYWSATQKSNKENRINNCVEYDLTSGATQATVEDIDVLNGIVVCCGYERSKISDKYIPKLWLNGKEIPLGEQVTKHSNVKPCAVAIVRR